MSKITKVSEQVDYSVFTTMTKDLGLFQVKAEIWSVVTPNAPSTDRFDHEITEICFVYSVDNKTCKYVGFKELYEKLYGDNSFRKFENDLESEFAEAYRQQTSYKN